MRSLFFLAVVLAGASAQESPGAIRDLVVRMEEDDIDVADQAAADLVKLGPAALDTLREIIRKREGDLKLRLQAVVQKIERAERIRKAMGTPPTVSVKFKDAPVAEVLAELSKQSGVKIEADGLPADLRISVEAERGLLWKVIDDLCRANGKIMYAYAPKRVVLQEGQYRDLPKVYDKGFCFFLDSFTWSKYPQGGALRSYCSLQAAVVWPPGTTPLSGYLEIQELEDDKGTNLAPEPQRALGFGRMRNWNHQQLGDALFLALYQNTGVPPADDATQLSKFRGKVVLQFALDTQRLLEIKNPVAQVGISTTGSNATLLIRSARRSGASLRFEMEVTTKYSTAEREDDDETGTLPWRIVLKDSKGGTHTARSDYRGSSSSSGGGWRTESINLSAAFTVPEGVEIESLELLRASEAEEVVLPFQFKGLPIREGPAK